MRVAGTCSSSASLLTVRPSGFMKSSRRISPGCTGGISVSVLFIFSSSLVIVDDFHVVAMTFAPDKADAPLIIDSDRVLSFPISSQGLQLVPWRLSQDPQFCRGVELEQVPQGNALDGAGTLAVMIVEKLLCFLLSKAPDQSPT